MDMKVKTKAAKRLTMVTMKRKRAATSFVNEAAHRRPKIPARNTLRKGSRTF